MKLSDAFPSNYLKAADLQGNEVKVRVDRVESERIGDENKLVVYFTGKKKGLVLNVTNARTIAKVLGSDDTDGWSGGEITLYSAEVQFKTDMVEAIRVKLAAAAPKSKNSKKNMGDTGLEEPFNGQF